MGVVGCPRNCAEATVKDIGLVGQEGSWQVVVGGAAGKGVRKADLLITVETTEQALEAAELFFQYYRENANYLERTYDFVERLGIEKIRKDTVYAAPEVKQALLDASAQVEGQVLRRVAGTPRAATHTVHRNSNPWRSCHRMSTGFVSLAAEDIPRSRRPYRAGWAALSLAIFNTGETLPGR